MSDSTLSHAQKALAHPDTTVVGKQIAENLLRNAGYSEDQLHALRSGRQPTEPDYLFHA